MVIRALELVSLGPGLPLRSRVDNGLAYISIHLRESCEKSEVTLDFIEPGKPHRNAYVERFSRTFLEVVSDVNLLISLSHAHQLTDEWREDYNNFHPRGSLGDLSPLAYGKSHHEASCDDGSVKAKVNSLVPHSALIESSFKLVAV